MTNPHRPARPGRGSRPSPLNLVTWVSTAQLVGQFLFLIRGLLLARLLGQFLFGVWNSMRVVRDLGRYLSLGAPEGMEQLAPYAEAAGDPGRADRLRSVATAMVLSVAVLVAGGVVGAALWRAGDLRDDWLVFAAVFVLAQLYLFSFAVLRTRHRFRAISFLTLTVTALTMLGLLAIPSLGLPGFLLVLGMSYGLGVGMAAHSEPRFRPVLDVGAAAELVRNGFPIMTANILTALQWNVDKLFLWAFRGNVELGLYSLSTHLIYAVMIFPRNVAAVMYPRLREQLGASQGLRLDRKELLSLTRLLADLAVPTLGLLWIGLELLVLLALPDYQEAVAPGRILLIGIFLPVLAGLVTPILISLGRRRLLIGTQLLGLLATVSGLVVVRWTESGLVAIALATAAGLSLQAGAALLVTQRVLRLPPALGSRLLVRAASHVSLLLVALLPLVGLFPASGLGDFTTAKRVASAALALALLGRLGFVIGRAFRGRRARAQDGET